MSAPRLQRADPPSEGGQMLVIFENCKAGEKYRLHMLLPSGESAYHKVTANKTGEVVFRAEATTPALHVIELQEGSPDERMVVATAHVTPAPLETTDGS